MKKTKCITKWTIFEMTLGKEKKADKNLSVEYKLCHTTKKQPERNQNKEQVNKLSVGDGIIFSLYIQRGDNEAKHLNKRLNKNPC